MGRTDGARLDASKSFPFRLIAGSRVLAGFGGVSGLERSADPVEHREGSPAGSERKRVGVREFHALTLKRGIVHDAELLQWVRAIAGGGNARRDLTLEALDECGKVVATWRARGAWVRKVEAPDLRAEGNEVAIETLQIECEGLELEEHADGGSKPLTTGSD